MQTVANVPGFSCSKTYHWRMGRFSNLMGEGDPWFGNWRFEDGFWTRMRPITLVVTYNTYELKGSRL